MAEERNRRADQRISDVAQRWFLVEPLLFSMYCTQVLTHNEAMPVPLRTGRGKIEYNPALINDMSDTELTDRLKVEALRIVLKHPYQRQPFAARPEILTMASNMTILDNMGGHKAFCFELLPKEIVEALPKGKTFEEYYGLLNRMFPSKLTLELEMSIDFSSPGDSDGSDSEGSDDSNSGDNDASPSEANNDALKAMLAMLAAAAALWEEDTVMTTDINITIQILTGDSSKCWGSLPGSMVDRIKTSLVPPIDVTNILKGFKKTILSNKRQLTRMRPSRRYGFEQMGSKYAYTTNVLVALDVSGSVDNDMLSRMLGMVNRIFKQGIENIDVLQFDTQLRGKPEPIRRAINTFTVEGRGGTDFQPVADYYMEHPKYDGLIYITDGFAPDPIVPAALKSQLPVTWIITDDDLIPTIRHGWP